MLNKATLSWAARIGAAALIWAGAVVTGCGSDSIATNGGSDAGTDSSVTCVAPQKACGTGCADTQSDFDNCGACGNKCASGQVCAAGACALFCSGGTTQCGTSCVNTLNDAAHCGTCTTACGAGQVCGTGKCALTCVGGSTQCGTSCVDVNLDGNNCGVCGTKCATGTVCAAGKCGLACGTGLTQCGGAGSDGGGAAFCADTNNDGRNCGVCGKTCDSGNVCVGGTCQLSCPAGEVICNGKCVDPVRDNQYCGATAGCGVADAGTAGTACASGNVCVAGACAVSCPGTEANCGGVCTDGQTDRLHCGATGACGAADAGGTAGVVCPAGNVCVAGACAVSCPGTEANCGGVCTDGQTDRLHCGATGACGVGGGAPGVVCPAGQVCSAGICGASCGAPTIQCGTTCVDPRNDPANCGGCGFACFGYCKNSACEGSVAIVASESTAAYTTAIRNGLIATAAFSQVDVVDARTVTPTAAQLRPYGALLVFSDQPYQSPALLGDSLATYYDNGGHVVLATPSFITPFNIAGRFGTVANGYIMLNVGAGSATAASSLGTVNEPASSLMAGVTTFAASFGGRSTNGVANGGIVVAAWADGTPLIVRGVGPDGRKRVDLNMFPPPNPAFAPGWTGNGFEMMRNALQYR